MQKLTLNGLESNIWKFTVHSVTNKRSYMTFLSIFLLTMPSATAKTIGLLTLTAQIVGFIFEIPSGFISDRIGHKNALILARLALILSTLMYILADSKVWFFVGAFFLALGMAFNSGTGTAFMQDTLVALKKDDQYAQIMGRVSSLGFAIPIVFILLLAFIAETSFRDAFLVAMVIDLIGLIAVLLLEKPPLEEYAVDEVGLQNFGSVLREFLNAGWLQYVTAGVLFMGITLGVTIGFKNPYQELLGFSIFTIGLFWSLARILISILLLFNGAIFRIFSFRQFILLEIGIVGISMLGIGLTKNMWMVAIFFILANLPLWGFASARSQYYIKYIRGSSSKATLLSMKGLLDKLVTGVVGLTMGALIANVSYQNAYLIVGFTFVLLSAGVILFVPRNEKS